VRRGVASISFLAASAACTACVGVGVDMAARGGGGVSIDGVASEVALDVVSVLRRISRRGEPFDSEYMASSMCIQFDPRRPRVFA
jgi:hypothetical protein